MNLADLVESVRINCKLLNIDYNDFLLYAIYSEYPIGTLDANRPHFKDEFELQKKYMVDEYDLFYDLQPTLDEDHAVAVQHARDIYDVLLGRF